MTLSIVTVVLNDLEGLRKTCESVLSQNVNLQYLIVDGGSGIESLYFLDSLTDKRVEIHTCLERGIYTAMNYSLKHVIGDYVLFMNAGDMFVDDYVCYDFLQQEFNTDVVYGDVLNKYESLVLAEALPLWVFRFKQPFCHQAVFTKVDILKNTAYDLRWKYLADFAFYRCLYYTKGRKAFYSWKRVVAIYNLSGVSNNSENSYMLGEERKEITGCLNYYIYNVATKLIRVIKILIRDN